MNKRLLLMLLAAALLLTTGCQLAVETVNEDGPYHQDRLAGVVVTTEYLDLFDMEAYLNDNLGDIMDGKDADQSAYQGRIYAREKIEEETNDEGVKCTTKYYNFDHVDGIPLLYYSAQTIREDGSLLADFTTGECGEGLWDVCFGGELTEGTIYYPADGGEAMVYLNPVYQDSEGRLYLVSGRGMNGDALIGEMSMNIHEERTETMDGEERTFRREFKITIKRTPIADQIVICQMDDGNQLINRLTVTPEELPEELIPMDSCAYLIVEEHVDGEITRRMLQPGDNYLTVYLRSEKAYCLGKGMDIRWPETE